MEEYLDKAKFFLFMQWNHAAEISIFLYCLNAAWKVKKIDEANKGPSMFWAQSLILTVFMGFGGGILSPLLLGKPILLLLNDLIVPCVVVSWFIVFRATWLMSSALAVPGAAQILAIMTEMFRAKGVITMVDTAFDTIKASKYYPIPLFGPIVLGTILGCGGLFLPFDKGLTALKSGAAWPLQSAFYVATFWHLTTHDPNIQPYLPKWLLDKENVHLVCASFLCVTGVIMTIYGPSFNPFAYIHDLLYKMTGVPRPEPQGAPSTSTKKDKETKKKESGAPPSAKKEKAT